MDKHPLLLKGDITDEGFNLKGVDCELTLSEQLGEIGIAKLTLPTSFPLRGCK